jgi:hypothetical protein
MDAVRRAVPLLLAIALGCGGDEDPTPPPKLPDILSAMEKGGFTDLVFAVVQHQRNPDGSQLLRLQGAYQGRTVGFAAWLAPTWTASKGQLPTASGLVELRSTGPESDAFVSVLAALYKTKAKPTSMAAATKFAGVSLEGNPSRLEAGAVGIKLFYEGKDDAYAEFFLDLDLPKKRAQLNEKDDGYREPLVRALAGPR